MTKLYAFARRLVEKYETQRYAPSQLNMYLEIVVVAVTMGILVVGLAWLMGVFGPLKRISTYTPPTPSAVTAAPIIRVAEPVPAAPLLSFILVMGSGRTLIYEAVKGGVEVMGCGGVSYTNSEGIPRRFGCGVTHLQSPQPLKLSERPVIETQTGAMFKAQ